MMRRKDAVIGFGTRRVRWAYSDRNQICRELAQKKPWLSEALPELTSLSAQDICYGADAWCVIVAGKRGGDGKLEKGLQDTMIASKSKHASGSVKLAFMWVDADREKTFTSALGIESAPRVAVLRTGKRTRYAKSDDDVTGANLEKFLERVLNSDVQVLSPLPFPPLPSPLHSSHFISSHPIECVLNSMWI